MLAEELGAEPGALNLVHVCVLYFPLFFPMHLCVRLGRQVEVSLVFLTSIFDLLICIIEAKD